MYGVSKSWNQSNIRKEYLEIQKHVCIGNRHTPSKDVQALRVISHILAFVYHQKVCFMQRGGTFFLGFSLCP
jgi:hypothetical protein